MTDKQLNIRLPEDLKTKFDELAKSSGLKQGELFAMLLDLADKDALAMEAKVCLNSCKTIFFIPFSLRNLANNSDI